MTQLDSEIARRMTYQEIKSPFKGEMPQLFDMNMWTVTHKVDFDDRFTTFIQFRKNYPSIGESYALAYVLDQGKAMFQLEGSRLYEDKERFENCLGLCYINCCRRKEDVGNDYPMTHRNGLVNIAVGVLSLERVLVERGLEWFNMRQTHERNVRIFSEMGWALVPDRVQMGSYLAKQISHERMKLPRILRRT